jgi:hypothetical protein
LAGRFIAAATLIQARTSPVPERMVSEQVL